MHPIEWLRAVARSGDVPQAELAGEAAAALSALGDDPQGLLMGCRRLLDRHPRAGSLWWTCARLVSSADPATEADAVRRDLSADQVGLSLALDLPDDARVTLVGWSALADELAARRGDVRLLAVAAPHDRDAVSDLYPRPRSAGRGRRRSALPHPDVWEPLVGDPDVLGPGGGSQDGDGGDPLGAEDVERIRAVPPQELGAAVAESDVVLVEAWAAGHLGNADDGWFLAAPGSLAAAAVARQRDAEVWMTVGVGRRLPASLFAAVRRRVFGQLPEGRTAGLGAGADMIERALVDRVIEPLEIGCPVPPELLRLA